MSSTYHSLNFHLVFATKGRVPLIKEEWKDNFHQYMGGSIKGLGGVPLAIGGTQDHIHLLTGLKATHCLSDFVREVKKASTAWAQNQGEQQFAWQEGYAAFSVSPDHRASLKEYIAHQEEHHKKWSAAEELRKLLSEHDIAIDERFFS